MFTQHARRRQRDLYRTLPARQEASSAIGLGLGARAKRNRTIVSEAETERPWAGVAEWLRAAHSLLDDKTVELTRNAD